MNLSFSYATVQRAYRSSSSMSYITMAFFMSAETGNFTLQLPETLPAIPSKSSLQQACFTASLLFHYGISTPV